MYFLPELPYSYDALGEAISADIMELHHTKHHQGYVDKLNAALADFPELHQQPIENLLSSLSTLPDSVRATVRNQGGGHYNHCLFWLWMSPQGGGQPGGELQQFLEEKYGSFQAFVDQFSAQALTVFGSGWVWLQPNGDIVTTQNQDSPLSLGMGESILGLDVWEHAYYLDYQYRRNEYVAAWWSVVNWGVVNERYARLR